MGRFILRKKQAGRSTQFELVTVEKEGVLKYTKNKLISRLSLPHYVKEWCIYACLINLKLPLHAESSDLDFF